MNATNASALAATLCREWDNAILFRQLATLRTDIELFKNVDELRWNGPAPEFETIAGKLDAAVIQPRAGGTKPSR